MTTAWAAAPAKGACPKGVLEVMTMSQRLLSMNETDDALAPCQQICPAQINIPLYIEQIKKGDYEGAVNTIREREPPAPFLRPGLPPSL